MKKLILFMFFCTAVFAQHQTSNPTAIDGVTNGLIVIDYPHHEIHSGDHYFIEGYATLGDGDSLRVKLVTPNTTKWAHFKWVIGSTGVLTTTFHEDASGGMANGSPVTPLNNNRNSANTSGMTITSGVDEATSEGTLLGNTKFGVASNPSKAIGGDSSREDELILKQNAIYLRTFISGSAGNVVSFKAFFYEHTSRN